MTGLFYGQAFDNRNNSKFYVYFCSLVLFIQQIYWCFFLYVFKSSNSIMLISAESDCYKFYAFTAMV